MTTQRIFVASAARLLTDRSSSGEGLIAHTAMDQLRLRGHEVVAVCEHADFATPPSYEVVELGDTSRLESIQPARYAAAVRRTFRELDARRRFTVVHWFFPETAGNLLFAPGGDVPFVVGPLFRRWPAASLPKRRLKPGDAVRLAARPLFMWQEHRVLDRADRILLSIPAAGERLTVRQRSRIQVLPPGLDTARFPVMEPPSRPRATFLGRLSEEKGVRLLLDAWPQVARVTAAELVIAGDGPLRQLAEVAAERDPTVRYLGPVPNPEVPALIGESTLICVPGAGEPYGFWALEAMACGRPIVAVDDGGPRFLLARHEGGRLVPNGDTAALRDALIELLADPDASARMGRANRARVEGELSLERMVVSLEEVYEQAQSLRG